LNFGFNSRTLKGSVHAPTNLVATRGVTRKTTPHKVKCNVLSSSIYLKNKNKTVFKGEKQNKKNGLWLSWLYILCILLFKLMENLTENLFGTIAKFVYQNGKIQK
jgi:hypothetical protein